MKYLIELMRFDVNLFFKYYFILAVHTVASHTSSDITSEFCVFTKTPTNIF
jgi:hypothetical protein